MCWHRAALGVVLPRAAVQRRACHNGGPVNARRAGIFIPPAGKSSAVQQRLFFDDVITAFVATAFIATFISTGVFFGRLFINAFIRGFVHAFIR